MCGGREGGGKEKEGQKEGSDGEKEGMRERQEARRRQERGNINTLLNPESTF